MAAVKVADEPGPPVTPVVVPVAPAASELAIQNPVCPPAGVAGGVTRTVYAAPASGVTVLGFAVTVPETEPEPWQPVQFDCLPGVACAAEGPSMAARTAAVRPVASTAAFGMLIFFKLNILTNSSVGPSS
jgi:hypothetical protein